MNVCAEIFPAEKTLRDLEPNDCRYPYGDRIITFCGQPKQEGSSYCPYHHELCYVPPRRGVR
jgi:GcrA cell cycle regulator